MINLLHVSKSFSLDDTSLPILQNITLSIKRGEFVAIMGPSGSGKSTLMYMIGLLDKPTSGHIALNGRTIEHLSDNDLSQLRNEFVGFVFQQFNLVPKLTVLENVLLPTLYAMRALPYDPTSRAKEILARVGMSHRIASYPAKLSGGEQQRVAIARALITNPQLILADEPTGNLDSKTGREILNLLTELNRKEHMTLIIVTHDREVSRRARRIIRIKDGKITH